MQAWELALRVLFLGLSAIMLIVSVQAWRRSGGQRMMWVMLSFMGFFLLASLVLLGLLWLPATISVPNAVVVLLTLIIGANYLALLKG